jgi:hypothetical protein
MATQSPSIGAQTPHDQERSQMSPQAQLVGKCAAPPMQPCNAFGKCLVCPSYVVPAPPLHSVQLK